MTCGDPPVRVLDETYFGAYGLIGYQRRSIFILLPVRSAENFFIETFYAIVCGVRDNDGHLFVVYLECTIGFCGRGGRARVGLFFIFGFEVIRNTGGFRGIPGV